MIPPLIGFFSKQYVLYSAIQNGNIFIALVAIFVSVISASYYLKIIKTFFIDLDYNESKLFFKQRMNLFNLATHNRFPKDDHVKL